MLGAWVPQLDPDHDARGRIPARRAVRQQHPHQREGLEAALRFGNIGLAAEANASEDDGLIRGETLVLKLEEADRFAIEQALSRT